MARGKLLKISIWNFHLHFIFMLSKYNNQKKFSVYNWIHHHYNSSLLLISERDMWWLITGTRSRRNEKWTRFHANDSISKYFCNLISWIGRFNLYIWTKERFGKNESAGDLNFFLSKLNKVASHTAADDSNLKNKPENRAWMYSPTRGDR